MFERAHGWTGLLVEAHPTQFYRVSLWMENRKLVHWQQGSRSNPRSGWREITLDVLGVVCPEEGLERCHLPGHYNKVTQKSLQVDLKTNTNCCIWRGKGYWTHPTIAGHTSVSLQWRWLKGRWQASYQTPGRGAVLWRWYQYVLFRCFMCEQSKHLKDHSAPAWVM